MCRLFTSWKLFRGRNNICFIISSKRLTKSFNKVTIRRGINSSRDYSPVLLLIRGIQGLWNPVKNFPSRLFSKFSWMTLTFKWSHRLLEPRLSFKRHLSFFFLPRGPRCFLSLTASFSLAWELPESALACFFSWFSSSHFSTLCSKATSSRWKDAKYNCPALFEKGLDLLHRLFLQP